jgi:hypothetical protein
MAGQLGLAESVLLPVSIPYKTYPAVVNGADITLATIPMIPEFDPQPLKKPSNTWLAAPR